jgi:ribosomal protein S18 acetylase RimI-like enzyme
MSHAFTFGRSNPLLWRRLTLLLREAFPGMVDGVISHHCREYMAGTDLAWDGSVLAGAVITAPKPEGVLWVEAIAVDARYRGRGLGRELMRRAEARASAAGYTKVSLATRRENTAAQRLYESLGYERAQEHTDTDYFYTKAIRPSGAAKPAGREPLSTLRGLARRAAYKALVTLPAKGAARLFPGSGSAEKSLKGAVDTRLDASAPRTIILEERTFTSLPADPVTFRNGMAAHPLFTDERIRRLLARVPSDRVEIRNVTTAADGSGSFAPRPERVVDLSAVEAFDRWRERPLWINVQHIERFDPDYAVFLEQYLKELARSFPEMLPKVDDVGAFLILSSGGSNVHFHADPDASFLNQIRGSKHVHTYPASVLPEKIVEDLVFTKDHAATSYDPAYEPHKHPEIHLTAGTSMLIPLYAPHRIVNDPEPSVSLSVGFHTARTMARTKAHLVNRALRARGFDVTPHGRRPVVDELKAAAAFALRAH